MRVSRDEKVIEIYCNKCGKKIEVKNQIAIEDVLSVDKKWGYFSKKDGIMHSFDICESCYNEMIKDFRYPVDQKEYSELI